MKRHECVDPMNPVLSSMQPPVITVRWARIALSDSLVPLLRLLQCPQVMSPCSQSVCAESECHSPYCIVHFETHGDKLRNFTAYNARWPMPGNESGGVEAMWYRYVVLSYSLGRARHACCES